MEVDNRNVMGWDGCGYAGLSVFVCMWTWTGKMLSSE